MAKKPKPNITGKVPNANTNNILAPSNMLPVPAAIIYIACKGPHASIKPFNNPIVRGLLCFSDSFPTNLLINRGVLILILLNQGNIFSMFIPKIIKKVPATIPATPLIIGVKAIIDPSNPKAAPIIV